MNEARPRSGRRRRRRPAGSRSQTVETPRRRGALRTRRSRGHGRRRTSGRACPWPLCVGQGVLTLVHRLARCLPRRKRLGFPGPGVHGQDGAGISTPGEVRTKSVVLSKMRGRLGLDRAREEDDSGRLWPFRAAPRASDEPPPGCSPSAGEARGLLGTKQDTRRRVRTRAILAIRLSVHGIFPLRLWLDPTDGENLDRRLEGLPFGRLLRTDVGRRPSRPRPAAEQRRKPCPCRVAACRRNRARAGR